jgi:hypothetical protein
MRGLSIMLLVACLSSSAFAQPMPGGAFGGAPGGSPSGSPTGRPSNPSGKIQIGYDKRADYPGLMAKAAAQAKGAKPSNTNAPDSLDGDIFSAGNDDFGAPTALVKRANPSPTENTQASNAGKPTTPTKPRSDVGLRSDAAPARAAAQDSAKAEAEKKAAADKEKAALAAAIAALQKSSSLPVKP